jgi:hypothetical protein
MASSKSKDPALQVSWIRLEVLVVKAYAGIGSRMTPEPILALMKDIGAALARQGWVLRSGAAPGADTAFEVGCDLAGGTKEVFLPWKGFQKRELIGGVQLLAPEIVPAAEEIAAQAHPRWQFLRRPVKALHTRNVCQVLGPHLDEPAKFILCWTLNGGGAGGTGQALRIAAPRGVKVFDLGSPEVLARIQAWTKSGYTQTMT